MEKKTLRQVLLLSIICSSLGMTDAGAQNGQPHSLKAEVNFTDVKLDWKVPTDDITLQWHDDEDYNGFDGILKDPQGSVELYAAIRLSASDLSAYAGQSISEVRYFEYREVFDASVIIFEDGTPVYEQKADLSGFEKNSWRSVEFEEPYIIPEGKEILVSVRYEYGRNMDFVAICDRVPTLNKGNLYSFDGEKWYSDGPGDFLITAVLHNSSTAEPDGYNIYRDNEKVNAELVAETEYLLAGESEGTHTYKVSAVYGTDEKESAEVSVNALSVYSYMPQVSGISADTDNLNGILTWTEPLRRGTEMGWSGKEVSTGIGGVSSTAPKVWIRHIISQSDLAAFPDHQITAINAYIYNDGVINTVTAFVMKNGEIDYYEEVNSENVSSIKTNEWNKFTFSTPYRIELGNEYSFGLYYTHTAGGHPVGVDNQQAIEGKGNSFSTSGVSSSGFDQSSPYWKTLSEGDIPGNFMLSADVEALSTQASEPQEITGYDIYRDGSLIAENVEGTSYTDEVSNLGTYTYAIITKGTEGKVSKPAETSITYTLPEEYKAPTIVSTSQEGRNIGISWSTNAYEMKHYGTASYIAGFAEEMPLIYGSRFTAEELAGYAGYKFKSMTFGIGDDLDGFKLKIIVEGGETIFEKAFSKGDIEAGYLYTLDFDDEEDVRIPEGKDVYLVYDAVLPANTTPILLDAGPEIEGGAVINLTGGAGTWLNLSTIASDYKGLNIVIGALIVEAGTAQETKSAPVRLGRDRIDSMNLERMTTRPETGIDIDEAGFGISPAVGAVKAPHAADKAPDVMSYRLYRNGELLTETESTSYTGTLEDYGVFDYYITSVYENGWESPASDIIEFTNTIAQRPQAPYDLKGAIEGKNLNLTWKPVADAPVLTYENGSGKYMAFGMTGTDVVEGYMVSRFRAEEIADKVGQEVAHITFRLNSTDLLSAAVVVLYGDNVVYMQEVKVSSLAVGANTVRLDQPVPVVPGQDLGIGYHLSYNTGVKPLVCDDGPTVADYYSDLISASGTPGYWKSMNADYKFNYNWAISATLKTADVMIEPEKAPNAVYDNITYTVYKDGISIESGLTEPSYVVENAALGEYTVTATVEREESAESNSFSYGSISDIPVVTGDNSENGKYIYSVDGILMNSEGDTSNLKEGIYIIKGKKIIVK